MPSVNGLGTTFNLPNYGGEILQATPTETPFLTAIGGLNENGEVVTSTEFEWQTQDYGTPSQPVVLEGADAPALSERSRGNVQNVVQIIQKTFGVSYTRQAARGNMNGVNNAQVNPITDELTNQTNIALREAARDINFTLLRGTYNKPSDNTTARGTRGLLPAITTNVSNYGTQKAFTVTAADDTFAITAHGYTAGQKVAISSLTNGAGLATNTAYYVRDVAANTFKVAATVGGAAVNVTSDGSGNISAAVPLTKVQVLDMIQGVWDSHGVNSALNPTIMCNATLKRALTKLFITDANYKEETRNIGGVSMTRLQTDFGDINLLLDRVMPVATLAFVHLGMCKPAYLLIPESGFLFVEPLAKTGAQMKYQLYGEFGLWYGAENSHARLEAVDGVTGA